MEKEKVLNFMGDGFIRLPRRVADRIFSQDSTVRELYQLYAALIVLCLYTEGYVELNRKKYFCRIGEYVTSGRRLSKHTGIYPMKVSRLLERLKEMELIEMEVIPVGCRIRVIGYELLTRARRTQKQPVATGYMGSTANPAPMVVTLEDERPPDDLVRRHKSRRARRKNGCRQS